MEAATSFNRGCLHFCEEKTTSNNASSSSSSRMLITLSGQVRIGTTTPSSSTELMVAGEVVANAVKVLDATTLNLKGGTSATRFISSTGIATLTIGSATNFVKDATITKTTPTINTTGSNPTIIFKNDTAGTHRMDLRIYIGIGFLGARTATPLQFYARNQALSCSFWNTSRSATLCGAVAGVSFPSTSDTRLKEQQEPSTTKECASIVDAVEPKRYYRKLKHAEWVS
jgi:hypothetical protein